MNIKQGLFNNNSFEGITLQSQLILQTKFIIFLILDIFQTFNIPTLAFVDSSRLWYVGCNDGHFIIKSVLITWTCPKMYLYGLICGLYPVGLDASLQHQKCDFSCAIVVRVTFFCDATTVGCKSLLQQNCPCNFP